MMAASSDIDSIDRAIDAAFKNLGYSVVKSEQREALRCVLSGRDCFLTVPTGFGKSAIFHALPHCAAALQHFQHLHGTSFVLIVSPLVSLMSDQMSRLCSIGIKTVLQLSQDKKNKTLRDSADILTHVFTSPEALLMEKRRELLLDETFVKRIIAVAIDEAHCVVKW